MSTDAGGVPLEEPPTMDAAIMDLVRQLKKAVDILDVVAIMMRAEAEMNAAKHLAGEVLPSPLCVRVQATRNDLAQSVRRYEGAADAE